MSGVEVLGIVASVIQITQYAMSITSKVAEIYGAVESAPARVQQGSDQLQRLCATVELIKDNPMIQTESVEAHLDAIVADAKTLHGMLSRLATSSKKSFKRYLRVWLGNFEERQIVAQFDKIEKEKTALILSLIEIHASFSNTTLYTVRPMANQVNDIHQDMQKLTGILQQISLENGISIRVTHPERRLAENYSGYAGGGRRPVLKSLVGASNSTDSSTPEFKRHLPLPQLGSYYTNIEARDQAKQLNGDIEDPDNRLAAKIHHYEGLVATGRSVQLNGNMSSAAFMGSNFGN